MSRRSAESPRQVVRRGLVPARAVEVVAPTCEPAATLALRPLRASDREEFIRVVRASRDHLERWIPIHRPGESDEALFERQLDMTGAGDSAFSACRRVAVAPGPGGRESILGAFNIITINRGLELSGDLNWWVAADSLGRGVGERGLRLLMSHAFAGPPVGLGLHVLRAYIQRDNVPSIRLAEKLRMTRREDGRSHIQTGERWVVHDQYAIEAPAG